MPVRPNLIRRKEATTSSNGTPASTTVRGDIIAGAVISGIVLLLFVFWLVNNSIPWFKRIRALQAVRKNALTDKEAVLAYCPTQQELQKIPATPLEDKLRLQKLSLALAHGLHGSSSSKKPRNNDQNAGKRMTVSLPESEAVHQSKLEPLGVLHDPVRDSGRSGDTIGSDMTLGTMISIGEAVPMRMALHTPQST